MLSAYSVTKTCGQQNIQNENYLWKQTLPCLTAFKKPRFAVKFSVTLETTI